MSGKQNPSEIISFVENIRNNNYLDDKNIKEKIGMLQTKFNMFLIDIVITINCECNFIKYLYINGAKFSSAAISIASCHGELELIQLLYSFLGDIPREAIIYSSRNGHYPILEFIYSKKPELFLQENDILINEASVIKKDMQLLQYLIYKGCFATEFSLKYSNLQNNIEIYNFLIKLAK